MPINIKKEDFSHSRYSCFYLSFILGSHIEEFDPYYHYNFLKYLFHLSNERWPKATEMKLFNEYGGLQDPIIRESLF